MDIPRLGSLEKMCKTEKWLKRMFILGLLFLYNCVQATHVNAYTPFPKLESFFSDSGYEEGKWVVTVSFKNKGSATAVIDSVSFQEKELEEDWMEWSHGNWTEANQISFVQMEGVYSKDNALHVIPGSWAIIRVVIDDQNLVNGDNLAIKIRHKGIDWVTGLVLLDKLPDMIDDLMVVRFLRLSELGFEEAYIEKTIPTRSVPIREIVELIFLTCPILLILINRLCAR